MEQREITCIECPKGCLVTVELENGKVQKVTGNSCPNGLSYAIEEVLNPRRMLTYSVAVKGGEFPVVSVKTQKPIPKGKLFEAIDVLKTVCLSAPVQVGQVVVKNILNTGIDVVATADVEVLQNEL